MRARRHPVLSIVLAVGMLAFLLIRVNAGPWADPDADRDAMIGTWTDEAGPPGNAIRFYYVASDIPGAPYATAYEGHVAVENFLGHAKSRGSWNYGGWDPLVLNVTVGRKPLYLAVRKLDDDHLLVRFGTDPEEISRAEAVDHPDARVLTRTGREPDGPFNRRPE
jgi:hypothetical protein